MEEYKVVLVDNFNRDWVSDVMLKDENKVPLEHLTKDQAKEKADAFNAVYSSANALWFAMVKPQDYKLHSGAEVYL